MKITFNPFTATFDFVNPPAGSTGQIQLNNAGDFGVSIISQAPTTGNIFMGATAITQNAFFYQNDTTRNNGFFGIYDAAASRYYGISTTLPAPAVNGGVSSSIGGYYFGLGIGGGTNSGFNPIFGVLNSSQSGNGIGNVALTVYANNAIQTFNNVLDDGSGSVTFGSNFYWDNTNKKLGVGTASPSGRISNIAGQNPLDQNAIGVNNTTSVVFGNSDAGYSMGIVNTDTGSSTNSNGLIIKLSGTNSNRRILTLNSNGTDVLFVTSVGTTIKGKTIFPGSGSNKSLEIRTDNDASSGSNAFIRTDASGNFCLTSGSGGALYLQTDVGNNTIMNRFGGVIDMTGASYLYIASIDLSLGNGNQQIISDNSNNNITFYGDGTPLMQIGYNGSIGISFLNMQTSPWSTDGLFVTDMATAIANNYNVICKS